MTTAEAIEAVGQAAGRIDSLIHATQLALPAELHLSCLKESLPEVLAELREIERALGEASS